MANLGVPCSRIASKNFWADPTQSRIDDIKITKAGTTPSSPGPKDWFTGTVRLDPLFKAEEPGCLTGVHVTFEPGARTAWHTHPAGQILIVSFGRDRVQRERGPIEEISQGDVIWFPAGEKHWNGASPETAMSHISLTESIDGSPVNRMEKVTDEECRS
jgi:quercetin dioxygenase-like cupin family protein